MITTAGLAALRAAATLTHSMPRLRARVRADTTVLVDVQAPDPDEPPPPGHIVMSPCAFRCAVAQAHRQHVAGQRLSFLHLPAGADPAVDIGTPPGGVARPGGLYRVPLEGRWMWAFATTLDADAAFELGRPIVAEAHGSLEVVALGIRPDAATGVSLAYAETFAAPGTPHEGALVDVLEGLLARWTTHELLSTLGDDAHDHNAL